MNVKMPDDALKLAETKFNSLKRIFIPIERRTAKGTLVFCTSDKEIYARLDDGSIRRTTSKVKGKAARRANKAARRKSRKSI